MNGHSCILESLMRQELKNTPAVSPTIVPNVGIVTVAFFTAHMSPDPHEHSPETPSIVQKGLMCYYYTTTSLAETCNQILCNLPSSGSCCTCSTGRKQYGRCHREANRGTSGDGLIVGTTEDSVDSYIEVCRIIL